MAQERHPVSDAQTGRECAQITQAGAIACDDQPDAR
jgi:hypothetical protein